MKPELVVCHRMFLFILLLFHPSPPRSAGNKTKLILRLQDHDKTLTSTASTFQQSTVQGDAPGVPHPPAPASPVDHLNTVFWNSSTPVEQPTQEEVVLPKMLVVGGDTHLGGGPSHNLVDESLATPSNKETTTKKSTTTGQGGLLDDIAEDMGIPEPREIAKALRGWFSRS
jgi:hypothetical protein